jgi:putative FmdB family regulatory protein
MPIYEYACPKCGEFEVTQRITEDPLRKCPTCKSKVRKLMSSTSFQLKGSGWYATDYAKKGTGKETGKDGGASSSSGESAAKSSDGEAKSSDGDSKSKDASSDTKSSEPAKSSKKKDTASKAA